MAFNLKNRHFLKELDFTPQEIKFFLDLAFELKEAKYAGTEQPRLKGKNIVLLFEKDSTTHTLCLRSSRPRPRCTCYLPRTFGLANG